MDNSPCDDVAAFLLGELTNDDEKLFKEHLKHCLQCQEELRDLMSLNESLLGIEESDTDMHLSKDLKEKTLERAFSVRKPNDIPLSKKRTDSRWRIRMLQVASSVAILMIGILLGRYTDPGISAKSSGAPAEMVQELSLKSVNSDLKPVGMAMVYEQGNQTNLVVYVKNLQSLDNYGCYSLWITEDNKRHNLGDFTVDAQGDAVLSVHLPNLNAATKLQITREPTWNDVTPQGPSVLSTEA